MQKTIMQAKQESLKSIEVESQKEKQEAATDLQQGKEVPPLSSLAF
jgi:hypothetical protein